MDKEAAKLFAAAVVAQIEAQAAYLVGLNRHGMKMGRDFDAVIEQQCCILYRHARELREALEAFEPEENLSRSSSAVTMAWHSHAYTR